MRIYERLKIVCDEKSLNIKDLSELTGLPYRTAQSYLSGDREPNANGMTILCTHLRVNINWLLTGIGDKYVQSVDTTDDYEHALLSTYRASNNIGRQVIAKMVDSVKDIPELTKTNKDE